MGYSNKRVRTQGYRNNKFYHLIFYFVNISKEHHRINAILDNYRAQVDTIPDDEFDVTPAKGGWSYAEVYSHIMQATMAASIALERCTHTTSKPSPKNGLNFLGRYVMLTGLFPPVKTTAPKSVEGRMTATKISKEEAKNLIVKCRKRMDDMAALIADTPSIRRMQHPRLGTLNAVQWLKFIRIHLQHHLKQLKRIDKNFAHRP